MSDMRKLMNSVESTKNINENIGEPNDLKLDNFEDLIRVLGDNPSQKQIERLEDFVLRNVPETKWDIAAEIALEYGIDDLYTEFSMRNAEKGRF